MAFSHWPIRLFEPKLSVSPETANCREGQYAEDGMCVGGTYEEAASVPSPPAQDPPHEVPRKVAVACVLALVGLKSIGGQKTFLKLPCISIWTARCSCSGTPDTCQDIPQ
ncbi:hypothetical protein A0H81_03790 [Grifola frondosa]|uniref:Uncharacterized protein n=1 Tax=Grifola frondosa TaxID=5627 RepID=A0A1C7MJ69_GRIFR|nr:hypothetical protein A0H81_03790 [Grifola frondosa]